MGRVIKGGALRHDAYRLVVPPPPPPPQAEVERAGFDAFASFDNFASDAPAAAPAVDLDVLEREAAAIIDAAAADAQRILDEAHARARSLVDDATSRAEGITRDARESGHGEGYAEGSAAVQRDMEEMLSTMHGLVDMARVERHKIIEGAEPEIVRLAIGIAERVLHQQIALDRNVVVEMTKTAISRLVDRETITVRVNPADLERMREHREEMLALGDVASMRVIEDQRVDRGGVILETEAGTIDAKISTQLAEVRKVLHIDEDIVVTPPAVVAARAS